MNWAVGANCYLLKAVHTHGKDWDLVSNTLQSFAKTFLKYENVQDFSKQSCSLQYNYIIASMRQKNFTELMEDQLLNLALDHYTTLRREQLHAARLEILRAIKIEEEDAEKLHQGRYAEIPLSRLNIYRKRCSVFGIPDKIGQTMKLEPLGDLTEEESKVIRDSVFISKKDEYGDDKGIEDSGGGLWYSVKTPLIADLFTHKPISPNIDKSVAKYIRDQAISFQKLTSEAQDEVSSLDTASSARTHVISKLNDENAHTEECDQKFKKIKPPFSPTECLEIQTETSATNSVVLGESETLTSPMNSSPSLSNVEVQSPTVKANINNPKRSRVKQKASTASSSYGAIGEFHSAHSPISSSGIGFDELAISCQSSITQGRRWRRALLSALSTVYSHRHAYVFMNPVTDDIAPGYSTVVHEAVDLVSLRRRMESSLQCLTSTQQNISQNSAVSPNQIVIGVATRFIRDLLLMFVNARMYNNQNHEVHRMAGEMFNDVMTELKPLWSIMSEDIMGFPPLPLVNRSTIYENRFKGDSKSTTLANSISCKQNVYKDADYGTNKSLNSLTKQNKRPFSESAIQVDSPPNSHKRHCSSESELHTGATNRSK